MVTRGTTEREIQELIYSRTGVWFDLERISLDEGIGDSAMISISHEQLAEILNWAFYDDVLNGRRPHFVVHNPITRPRLSDYARSK
jgi:hypothetical protein